MAGMARRIAVAETLGSRLRAARGDRTLYRVAVALEQALGRTITPETIRAYEADEVRRPNLGIVVGLAALYGRRMEDLAPELVEEAERLSLLLRETVNPPGDDKPTISVMSSRPLALVS